MKLLLDTHFAYWLVADAERISVDELLMIETSELAVSAVSIWEFRLKWLRRTRSGARKGPVDPAVFLSALHERELQLLPLRPEQAAALLDPPLDHSDPFDEMLLTHAQQIGGRLLTRDGRLARHPMAVTAP